MFVFLCFAAIAAGLHVPMRVDVRLVGFENDDRQFVSTTSSLQDLLLKLMSHREPKFVRRNNAPSKVVFNMQFKVEPVRLPHTTPLRDFERKLSQSKTQVSVVVFLAHKMFLCSQSNETEVKNWKEFDRRTTIGTVC